MTMEIMLITFLFMINILAHFFEPPHSIFLRQQKEIQETSNQILKSNEEIIKLIKEKL
jgi:hypothetical protein